MSDNRLLGRGAELAVGEGFLDHVAKGPARGLVIAGEAGMGKTTLAQGFVDRAKERGFRTAWTWCWLSEETPPLWPWRQAGPQLGWNDVRWGGVAEAFEDLAGQLNGGPPSLIVLDDAHGADEASLSLVNLCLRSLPDAPLGIVLTVCEEDVPPGTNHARSLDAISRAGERIDLLGLTREATQELFEQAAGGEIPPLIGEAVSSASEGNPFLIEQLAQELAQGQDLLRPDRSMGFKVPRGADAVLVRMVDRLSEDAVALLTVASVLGRTFSNRLLGEIAQKPPEVVSSALQNGIEKGVVRKVDALGSYEFSHALLREMLYEGLPDDRRCALHLRAAEAIESGQDPSRRGDLAHHLFKAGTDQDVAHAVDVILEAAASAEAEGANDEAARHFYRAARLARVAGLAEDTVARAEAALHAVENDPTGKKGEERRLPELQGTFQKQGEFWAIGLGSDRSLLKDSKGMRYLASLLATPQKEWHCLEMATPAGRDERPQTTDTGPVLDAQAKAQFRQRLLDIEEEIAEATEYNDNERSRKAEEEKQFLLDELSAAAGLGGRDRVKGSDSERARVAVTRAIRSALRRISTADAKLGDHLDRTIQTGTFLSYRPDPMATPKWEL